MRFLVGRCGPRSGRWERCRSPAWLGCGISPSVITPNHADSSPDFTVVTLPDTQYYAASHPEILDAQIEWIAREVADQQHRARRARRGHRRRGRAAAVVARRQLAAHARRCRPLRPQLRQPRLRSDRARTSRDETLIDRYFEPPSTGLYEPGRIENRYRDRRRRRAVPGWSSRWSSVRATPCSSGPIGVAKRYAALPAIVVTHAYLASDDARFDHLGRPRPALEPAPLPRRQRRGQRQRRRGDLAQARRGQRQHPVRPLRARPGRRRRTARRAPAPTARPSTRSWPTTRCSRWAAVGTCGSSQFSPAERRVRVRTYSPYLNQFKTDDDNDFHLVY